MKSTYPLVWLLPQLKYSISVPSLYLQTAVPVVLSKLPGIHVASIIIVTEVKSMEHVVLFIQIL